MNQRHCEIDRWENEGGPPVAFDPRRVAELAKRYNTCANQLGALKRRRATLQRLIQEEGRRPSACGRTLAGLQSEHKLVDQEISALAKVA